MGRPVPFPAHWLSVAGSLPARLASTGRWGGSGLVSRTTGHFERQLDTLEESMEANPRSGPLGPAPGRMQANPMATFTGPPKPAVTTLAKGSRAARRPRKRPSARGRACSTPRRSWGRRLDPRRRCWPARRSSSRTRRRGNGRITHHPVLALVFLGSTTLS